MVPVAVVPVAHALRAVPVVGVPRKRVRNAPLGVQAGHAAGCFTIGVTTGPIPEKDLYKAGADIVYKSMDELADALPSLFVALTVVKA